MAFPLIFNLFCLHKILENLQILFLLGTLSLFELIFSVSSPFPLLNLMFTSSDQLSMLALRSSSRILFWIMYYFYLIGHLTILGGPLPIHRAIASLYNDRVFKISSPILIHQINFIWRDEKIQLI